jgi:hypothetical protein
MQPRHRDRQALSWHLCWRFSACSLLLCHVFHRLLWRCGGCLSRFGRATTGGTAWMDPWVTYHAAHGAALILLQSPHPAGKNKMSGGRLVCVCGR